MMGRFTRSALKISSLPAFLISIGLSCAAHSETYVQIEGSATWQSLNRAGIPGDTGTRFDLVDFSRGPFPTFRLYAGYKWNKKHEVRALYAPLDVQFEGRFGDSVDFLGTTFAANTSTIAGYKFNSYRLTYAYHPDPVGDFRWAIGFTAKVRDAEVRLTQGGTTAAKENVGFVPLLHAQALYSITDNLKFRFDFDGLAAPQGRAFDVLLAGEYAPTESLAGYLGYRTVEGGADNKTVYNFAWLHYLTAGLRLSL
jgi:hypothetical protein